MGGRRKILLIMGGRGDYDFSPPTRVDNINYFKNSKKWKKEQ